MQTLGQIRQMLHEAGLRPQRRLGQCFLIDGNLMAKLVELADLTGCETVLEVGSGTGSLTEELLGRARRVVAVEIDRGLHQCIRQRLGDRDNLTLLRADALARKHAISPAVLEVLGGRAHLVANLPYTIATPLVADCLVSSYRAVREAPGPRSCRFDRLTFTVQQEVADRLAAACGSGAYGRITVIASLLGRLRAGPGIPSTAFWPRPKVTGRIVRIDFDPEAAAALADVDALQDVLQMAFCHRRKQIGSLPRRARPPYTGEQLTRALAQAEIDCTARPQAVPPEQFLRLANAVAAG